jgi:hypothetical protein
VHRPINHGSHYCGLCGSQNGGMTGLQDFTEEKKQQVPIFFDNQGTI